MTTGKTTALTIQILVGKWCLCLICYLGLIHCHSFSSKEQVSFLNFMAAVTICSDFGVQENSLSLFPLFPHLSAMKWWDWMPWSSFFENWVLSQLFHSPFSPSSRSSLVPLHFLPLGWYHLHIWGCWHFSQQSWFRLVNHPADNFWWCLWSKKHIYDGDGVICV